MNRMDKIHFTLDIALFFTGCLFHFGSYLRGCKSKVGGINHNLQHFQEVRKFLERNETEDKQVYCASTKQNKFQKLINI